MTAAADRARSAYRGGITLLVAAALYEAIARSGTFPAALLPTLPKMRAHSQRSCSTARCSSTRSIRSIAFCSGSPWR